MISIFTSGVASISRSIGRGIWTTADIFGAVIARFKSVNLFKANNISTNEIPRASFIRQVNVNITDMDDLDRRFSTGRWTRSIWLRGWKVDRVFSHGWEVTESKNSGAEESRRR